ncbi:MAG: glycosyltransferase [Planctomycetota bacterium]|jgi:glycosyltransferase involved in cell wall biosynthesis
MELVSIIIPVYNERATLRHCVERVLDVDIGAEREIIIVDDGSTDGSADVVRELGSTYEEVKPGYFKKNRGKGAAVKAALEVARGTVAVVQDADLEYDPRDLPRVLRPILEGRADAVFGSRLSGGREHRVLYYRHAIGNRFITFISNVLTDLNLTDVETGYKAFRLDLVKGLPIRSRSFTFEIEITAKLAHLGARIYEVPISYHGRSYQEGKKISWVDGIWALLAAVRFRLFPGLGRGRLETRARVDVRRLRRFNRWLARKLLRWTGDRVIEYAPDVGTVTAHLVRKERVVCVEPQVERATFVARRFGHRPNVRVIAGEVHEDKVFQALRVEDADTVLCVNALACVKDDEGVMREFAGVLEPGGRLVLFLPRGRWLYSPLDRARRYVRRYSKRYLYDKLVRAGFEVERMRSFNRVGVLTWFLWGKILRRRRAGGLLLGLYDRLTFLWRMLDWILPLPGLSLIVVARKRG